MGIFLALSTANCKRYLPDSLPYVTHRRVSKIMNKLANNGFYRRQAGRLSRGAVLDIGLKCTHSSRFCCYSFLDGSDNQFIGMRRAKFRTLTECKRILKQLKQLREIRETMATELLYYKGELCDHFSL